MARKISYPNSIKVDVAIWKISRRRYWVNVSWNGYKLASVVEGTLADAQTKRSQLRIQLKKNLKTATLENQKSSSSSLTVEKFKDVLNSYKNAKEFQGVSLEDTSRMGVFNRLKEELGDVYLSVLWERLAGFVAHYETNSYVPAGKKNAIIMATGTLNRHVEMAKAAIRTCYVRSLNRHGKKLISENFLDGFIEKNENNLFHCYLSNSQKQSLVKGMPTYLWPLILFIMCRPVRIEEFLCREKSFINNGLR